MGNAFTHLFEQYCTSNKTLLDKMIPIIYRELHTLAHRYMKGEPAGHTLQTTALINEVYLKLVDTDTPWKDHKHFFSVAATIMRHVLVDHAKSKKRFKRGGGLTHIEFNDAFYLDSDKTHDLVALDKLLTQLASIDKRASRVFELYTFGGLQRGEISETEHISTATVDRDLRFAKAWLISRLCPPG
ncbi:MAG: ECF-type sigma factor [Exilibacterium sp.]